MAWASPRKRAEEALAATMTVKENLFLNPVNFGHSLPHSQPRQRATRRSVILKKFDVRPPDPERDISTLSGGNQQKSCWLDGRARSIAC